MLSSRNQLPALSQSATLWEPSGLHQCDWKVNHLPANSWILRLFLKLDVICLKMSYESKLFALSQIFGLKWAQTSAEQRWLKKVGNQFGEAVIYNCILCEQQQPQIGSLLWNVKKQVFYNFLSYSRSVCETKRDGMSERLAVFHPLRQIS